MINTLRKEDRKPSLVLDTPPYNEPYPTTVDHGLGVLSFLAGDGVSSIASSSAGGPDVAKCFVLGPAFDLKVRPIGLGQWSVSHVASGFKKIAEDTNVRLVTYSSGHFAVPGGTIQGVTIDHNTANQTIKNAVLALCGSPSGKILVCSAGNQDRPIDNGTGTFFVPQVWGPGVDPGMVNLTKAS
jgi:hypothetical protein